MARRRARQANREVKFPGTRSRKRESVTADVQRFLDGRDGPQGEEGDGSAGVREPRNPKPLPMSSAGERPMPQQEFVMSLPDPRY